MRASMHARMDQVQKIRFAVKHKTRWLPRYARLLGVEVKRPKLWLFSVCWLAISILPCKAYAWSYSGHAVILASALSQLDPAARKDAIIHIDYLYDRVSSDSRFLPKYCLSQKPLCIFAAWPDRERDKTLGELYRIAGAEVPAAMRALSSHETANWHFANKVFNLKHRAFSGACAKRDPGQLYDVLPQLASVLQMELSIAQRAVTFSLWTHLLADAHQPLHNLTGSVAGCSHDYGGNGLCVVKRRNKCERSLHQLWDSGAGLFDKPDMISPLGVAHIRLPIAVDYRAIQNESLALATEVYAPNLEVSSRAYVATVQRLSRLRAEQAAQRIALLLKELTESGT
ncbi:S1/P1 nuclease [Teredinibacter turnerae]|uniref:S1/P1 nuclease n=1 Tax=Teredinibacter turnerae TaxID=2426 RepID=UPI0004763CDD|nr:S1/P1 nuclease [Teredinibacter turnerae]